MNSANQGRESVERLVQEEEIPDLLEYSHREGLSGRDIVYEEGSMTAWISSDYVVEASEML